MKIDGGRCMLLAQYDPKMNRKEAFPESWEQFAEMIKSFEYAGVVDSQSV